MLCAVLDFFLECSFYGHMVLDGIIDVVGLWYVVNLSYFISLFEYEVAIIQDVCQKSMPFDIDFEESFHIHVFDIIDEEKARMYEYDRVFCYEENPSSIVDTIEDQASKNIIHSDEERREEDIGTEFTRKHHIVSIKYIDQNPDRYERNDKFRRHKKQEYAMSMYFQVSGVHRKYDKKIVVLWTQKEGDDEDREDIGNHTEKNRSGPRISVTINEKCFIKGIYALFGPFIDHINPMEYKIHSTEPYNRICQEDHDKVCHDCVI